MEKAILETVKVYSPIEDKEVRQNLGNSPIFKGTRYHESELTLAKKNHEILYEYSFKFEGLNKVVQFTGMKKIVK
jgi:hypothetical protein